MALLPALPTAPAFTGISLSPKTNAADRVWTDGTYKGFTFHISKPTPDNSHGVTGVQRSTERKLQVTDRALMDGADIHDFGRHAKQYSADIIFFGPNFIDKLNKFDSICNDGLAGVLILPDEPMAVLAYFKSSSIISSVEGGETLTVRVEWIGAASKPTPKSADATLTDTDQQIARVVSSSISIAQGIQNVQNVINNNVFLKTLESAKTNAQQLQVFVQSALNYPAAVKANILKLEGDILATIAICGQIVNSIVDFVHGKNNAKSSAAHSTTSIPTTTDPVTGQQINDFADNTAPPAVVNPLAPPSPVPNVVKNIPDIKTDQSCIDALEAIIAQLISDMQGMQSGAEGRISDVVDANTGLINDLNDMILALKPRPLIPYMVLTELSLNEILFINGITVDQADQVHRNNPHLDDIMVIESGEVVYL